ncbi:hypothetical protein C8R48DRAFT_786384 [Suillus tomentosus]|nr:hypothetical protein C8R48DRAFT_786384 [Suillus tomentosus]
MSNTKSSSADSWPSDFNDGAEAILINTTFGAHRAGKGIHRSRSSTPQSHKDSCLGPAAAMSQVKKVTALDNVGQGSTNGKKVSWKNDRLRRKFGYLIDEILGVLEATLLEQHVVVISIDAIQHCLPCHGLNCQSRSIWTWTWPLTIWPDENWAALDKMSYGSRWLCRSAPKCAAKFRYQYAPLMVPDVLEKLMNAPFMIIAYLPTSVPTTQPSHVTAQRDHSIERLTLSMHSQMRWVNLAFKWIYLTFLALQFVLALGNRPKSERTAYGITLQLLISKAFTNILNELKNNSKGDVLGGKEVLRDSKQCQVGVAQQTGTLHQNVADPYTSVVHLMSQTSTQSDGPPSEVGALKRQLTLLEAQNVELCKPPMKEKSIYANYEQVPSIAVIIEHDFS